MMQAYSWALGMVRNTATGRWHPMLYKDAAFPGGFGSDLNRSVVRYRSHGHHTAGFDTRESADAENEINREKLRAEGCVVADGLVADWEWDGEGVPDDVRLVSSESGATLPRLKLEVAAS